MEWLLYPLVIVGVGFMAASFGYILAIANVYFRDTGQLVGLSLQLLFFLTPVIYPVELVPQDWHGIPLRSLLVLNPMTDLVEITRDLLYALRLPSPFAVGYSLAWIAALGLAARFVHRRWGQDICEAV